MTELPEKFVKVYSRFDHPALVEVVLSQICLAIYRDPYFVSQLVHQGTLSIDNGIKAFNEELVSQIQQSAQKEVKELFFNSYNQLKQ